MYYLAPPPAPLSEAAAWDTNGVDTSAYRKLVPVTEGRSVTKNLGRVLHGCCLHFPGKRLFMRRRWEVAGVSVSWKECGERCRGLPQKED